VRKRSDGLKVTLAHVDLALELCGRHRLGYCNALIVAASRLAGCSMLFSGNCSTTRSFDYERREIHEKGSRFHSEFRVFRVFRGQSNSVRVVTFSEDLSHGHDYEGVRIENQL